MSAPTTTLYVNRGKVERIFLTYKARIAAENRMKRMGFWSQATIAWYSLWITLLSLAEISGHYVVRDGGVITTFFSISILTTSIFLYAQRYEIRGAGFRECYLKLRELYDSEAETEGVLKSYNALLTSYENHAQSDYDEVLFNSWFSERPLHDENGEIPVPRRIIARYIIRWMSGLIMFGIFLSIPILSLIYAIHLIK